jgi:hypothetical protein
VRLLLLVCCVALPTVDARTSTPPKEQASIACLLTAATSTSATSASRGYHLLGVHTGLFSSRNIRTLTMLRLRGDFNPSTSTFSLYSSLIMCGALVATTGGCYTVCVGRHHCWVVGPLGLGLSLYIVPLLYAIQQFTILQCVIVISTPKTIYSNSKGYPKVQG